MEFIEKNENGINYLIHPENSIFAGMKIRENPEQAFDNAIKRGMKHPENWMYMYSNDNRDYFKHIDSRGYTSYLQFGIVEQIKNKLFKER